MLGYSKVKPAKPSSQGLVESHQRKSLFLPELIDVLALDGHVMQKVIWAGMRLLFDRVVNWHGNST